MHWHELKQTKHCRWCSKVYYAKKPAGRDGFCSKAHKQALYRALKHYVTGIRRRPPVHR